MGTTAAIANKIINGVKKAQIETEELQLQLALGKLEARDIYHDSKKKFYRYLHDIQQKAESVKSKKNEIITLIDELKLQLKLGKADTIDAFNKEKKVITNAIKRLEKVLQNNEYTFEVYSKLRLEIEKFKIKLEILKLHYDLNKIDAKDEFEVRKKEFFQNIDILKEKISSSIKSKSDFSTEIKLAYKHLKKAFDL